MKARVSLLAALLAAGANAQTITTGELIGRVTDSTGALVLHASVLLKSVDTGESRTAEANSSGTYRFTLVTPGIYEISGAAAGLKSDTERVAAVVGDVAVVDLVLKIEEMKAEIMVADSAPLIQTDNANITFTVSERQLELLPLPGGDLVGVAYSVPGVVINYRSGAGNIAGNGIGSVSNLFTVNGVDDMIPYSNVNNSGTTGLLLGANEIREASVVQNAYDGQYGRQAGMQVNYVSRSGSNSLHGNLAYTYNGSRLNANDFFGNASGAPRPHGVSNQYAAGLGGRIVRDRLFFFADTEGLRLATSGTSGVVAVPSPEFESYSLRTIQPSQVPLYQKMFALYNNAPGHDRAVPVGNGDGPLEDSSGALGCGRLAGTPTGTGGVFGKDVSCAEAWGDYVPSQTSEWLLSTRVDYNLSARQRMFFRFKTDQGHLAFKPNPINPAFGGTSTQPDYEGQLNHTFVVSPRLVNNFIGAATYNDYVFAATDLSTALKLFPFRFNFFDGGANGASIASIGAPAGFPTGQRTGQIQIIDDLAYNAGRHSIKTGVNLRYNRETDLEYSSLTYEGRFQFDGLDELANGAINAASGTNYTQSFAATPVLHLRLYNLGAYVQDRWAPTTQLTITATIRLDRTGNPYCQEHCFARLSVPFEDLAKGAEIPYNQSILTGQAHALYGTDAIVPQPRLSAVYSPAWSKATVFRGGIGVFSDLYAAAFAATVAGNAPNVYTPTIRTGLVLEEGAASAPGIATASANAFMTGFANGATLAQLQQAVAPAAFSPPPYLSLSSTVHTPRYLEWSLEMEHRLGTQNALTLRYAGNYGYDLFLVDFSSNANANPASYPNGFGGLPAAVPDPRFAQITRITNNGFSRFAGMTAQFRHTWGHGLEAQASYTWSHALDTISNSGFGNFSYDSLFTQVDPMSRSLNYSNADYDVRHNLAGDAIWQLPVKCGRHGLIKAACGWSLGTRWSAHTGMPFSVYNSRIPGQVSTTGLGTVLADVVDPAVSTHCGQSSVDTPCFTAQQFATAATQTDFGNLPRNSFRGPGFLNVDASFYRTIAIRERTRFVLGASAYNLLNHPNFADPNADVARGGLGLIQFTIPSPSGPYGSYGGPAGRAIVVTGKLAF
ncbi:MAG TPA: carboxypeptidase regulatory-like domain-containing protein [Bryobacteraceae bacterium]|nr:carboxypeptidase regulatory-like domain-containing protein [Bryobacteraceae bacterium]